MLQAFTSLLGWFYTPATPFPIDDMSDAQTDHVQALNALARLGEIFNKEDDIHIHTRALGKIAHDFFVKLDQKHQLTSVQEWKVAYHEHFETTAREIILEAKKLSKEDSMQVGLVCHTMRFNANVIDYETQMNAVLLLVKTWELAKQSTDQNARGLVIDNLRHNLEADGKCYAGITARLIQPYALLLTEKLASQLPLPLNAPRPQYTPMQTLKNSDQSAGASHSHESVTSEQTQERKTFYELV